MPIPWHNLKITGRNDTLDKTIWNEYSSEKFRPFHKTQLTAKFAKLAKGLKSVSKMLGSLKTSAKSMLKNADERKKSRNYKAL